MRSLIRCIATARACAVIGAPFTAGLAKTKGDFRAAIAIASVISCIANTHAGDFAAGLRSKRDFQR